MESNLLQSVKFRVFDELEDSLQQNELYRDKVQVFHKYPYREQHMMGIYLKNASATRIRLSGDDYAGALKSFVALARAENFEGVFLDWVWEDSTNLTIYKVDEDVSSQNPLGTNRMFYVTNKPIISGNNNLVIANNFRQVNVTVNGVQVFPEFVDGASGLVMLSRAPLSTDTVLISYWYGNLTPPGRYYLRIVDATHFNVSPLYVVEGEKVIAKTTGTETTASLDHGDYLVGNFDILYTKQSSYSNNFYLINGTDYTITTAGVITFLNPLQVNTTLYANYRWAGTILGPFDIPKPFHYNNTALPGISLAFSDKIIVDDKQVVIVSSQRELAASVYSGHWDMTFDIEVFARDPIQLPELTDHIINDMWSRKRLDLISSGLTIESMEPTGEVEEVYVDNTNDQYYKNSVNLIIKTEWKKFKPYLTKIMDINVSLYPVSKTVDYIVNSQGEILELNLSPLNREFEVTYPKQGFPRYL